MARSKGSPAGVKACDNKGSDVENLDSRFAKSQKIASLDPMNRAMGDYKKTSPSRSAELEKALNAAFPMRGSIKL